MKNPSIKRKLSTLLLGLFVLAGLSAFNQVGQSKQNSKHKIGFLVHDLVGERWQKDMDNFANKVEELGGIPITKNAFGDPVTQVNQGKMLIDEGVEVLAIVATDANALTELVNYANEKGVKVIAYDRMIMNCDLDYYISFNSVKAGELMTQYAVERRPKGKYVIIHGPSADNNALLLKQGQMNVLKPYIESGDIEIVLEEEVNSWGSLDALMLLEEFLSGYEGDIDAVITGADDLSTGSIDALKNNGYKGVLITGQDASLEACKNIVLGNQTMTIYKSIKKLSSEAAILAMDLANGKSVKTKQYINNGEKDVPSVLFEPIVVDKTNLNETVVAEGHIKKGDLRE